MTHTMQHIYDTEVLVCCPSKGRADTCTTHNVLPSVKYFVAPEEYEQYIAKVPKENVIKLPEGIQVPPVGKCRALNYILDNYKTKDNVILFTDDDIFKLRRVDFLNKPLACKETNEEEVLCCIKKMKFIADKIGAKIGGFAALGGSGDVLQMGLSNRFKLAQKKYIDGKAFIIYDDDGTRYSEDLYLKEDIDFNCQSLLKNKRTLSVQFVVFNGKALTNAGGVCDVRSREKEIQHGAKMIDKYGQMLTLRISQIGDGVRKNAVQFGIK